MRIFLTIILVALSAFSFSQEMDPIEKISNAPVITASNASTFTSYENTLESVVNFFYASQIRKDKEWEKVLPFTEKRTEILRQKLQKYEGWHFTKFSLTGKVEHEVGKFWVFINIEITADGKTTTGNGRVEVELIDGNFVITGIPA